MVLVLGPDYRKELIPLLKCKYFNPVVSDWNETAQEIEKKAKEDCQISLYVITPYMEGIFSIAEIMEDVLIRRINKTVVCILKDYYDTSFSDKNFRSLMAFKNLLLKYNCEVFDNLVDTAIAINNLVK